MNKVALIGCSSYDERSVKDKLYTVIEALGGIEKYIQPNQLVLLKANLLMKRNPSEATTTHPVVVKALAEILIEHGIQVVIGDSPGGPFNAKALNGIYEICGYHAIETEDIKLNQNFNSTHVQFEKGMIMKQLDVIEVMTKVDAVISVAKLKTHGMTKYTGAVKNLYGTIPGLKKAEYHYTMPELEMFSNMLVDVCEHANPVLSFIDGITGMEGAGPSGGEPRDIGVLLAGPNPHSLDVAACDIIGVDPSSVPTLQRALERKLISLPYEMVLESVEGYKISDFKIPSIKGVGLLQNRVPKWADRLVDYVIKPKPVIVKSKCIGCGECVLCCPAHTIDLKNKKANIHLEACIRCFCCQELCPVKAIDVYRHPIGKILTKI